eukprot:scaffold449976_cov49-Prasinocladus_malaysianus.AAC.1
MAFAMEMYFIGIEVGFIPTQMHRCWKKNRESGLELRASRGPSAHRLGHPGGDPAGDEAGVPLLVPLGPPRERQGPHPEPPDLLAVQPHRLLPRVAVARVHPVQWPPAAQLGEDVQ